MATPTFHSSGNLTADRRLAYAVDLLADGEALAAGDLIEQALELAPDWPGGWFSLARAREATGDRYAAIAAFMRAADLDAADELGARLHLVRLGALATPAEPPQAYVRGLFDEYADRFDSALVDGLDYCAPQLLAAALAQAVGSRHFARGLDLGCGTGLMAAAMNVRVGTWHGVDLSPRMITVARAKGLYATLEVGDIVAAMDRMPAGSIDLITAADVFCYLGDLAQVIRASERVLAASGALTFTVESVLQGADPVPYHLADSLRFRHTAAYVTSCVVDTGLTVVGLTHETLRKDRGIPVRGVLAVAVKTADHRVPE